MEVKTVRRIVVALVVLLATGFACATLLAFEESSTVLQGKGKSLDVLKAIERLEDIMEYREDATAEDIQYMIKEFTLLQREIDAFLFSPDGTFAVESDDDCSALLVISSLYILRGVTLVISLLSDVVQTKLSPPQTQLQEIRTAIKLIRTLVRVVIIAPISGYNGLLTFLQYMSCKQAADVR